MPVRFEVVDGQIAHIVLDRPEALNSIDPEMHQQLVDAWRRYRDTSELRVAVLSGAGDRAFCAGIDVKKMGETYRMVPPEQRREIWNREPGLGGITRNLDPGKPVLAAVHGHCLGAGLELALACDMRVASPEARFGLPEVKLGIIPGQGGTQRLPRAVPPAVALEMILTAEPISADRALQAGLISRIFPRGELLSGAFDLARSIARHPPRAVRAARESVLRGLSMPLAEALRLEQDLADPLRDSPENRAAREQFAQRDRRA